jgi:hypothetical protein
VLTAGAVLTAPPQIQERDDVGEVVVGAGCVDDRAAEASRSRKKNIGGMVAVPMCRSVSKSSCRAGPARATSASTSTPGARSVSWSASMSSVDNAQ